MTSEQLNKIGADVMSEWRMNFSGVELDFALEVASRAVEAEREACAKACEALRKEPHGWNSFSYTAAANDCASAIRARSNAE